MSDRPFSRRDFLLSVGVAGAASAVLTACNGRQETPAPAEPAAPGAPAPGQQAQLAAADCPGYDQLTEDDRAIRNTLDYTDVSPREGQYCDNCRFQIESEDYGACLGCQLFAGPVAPRGWCSSWVAIS